MEKLWFYIVCWKHRNVLSHEFLEQYMLILKAARRCAYDLAHAGGNLYGTPYAEFYSKRARMWQNLFTPQGGKDYRHDLHIKITDLESKLELLEELCEKNNIELPYETIPF